MERSRDRGSAIPRHSLQIQANNWKSSIALLSKEGSLLTIILSVQGTMAIRPSRAAEFSTPWRNENGQATGMHLPVHLPIFFFDCRI
jgi:hypothetical protein